MAVLISTIVKNQTQEGYDSVLAAVIEQVKQAPGFIAHCAYPMEDQNAWSVTEIWESKQQADQFFGKFVVPNVPKGVTPKRSYHELHSIVTPQFS
jgi:heme-degrading monooxygenase HmoA